MFWGTSGQVSEDYFERAKSTVPVGPGRGRHWARYGGLGRRRRRWWVVLVVLILLMKGPVTCAMKLLCTPL